MRYPDSVAFLYSLGNEVKSVKLELEGIRAVLYRLGNPQRLFRSVHVAGTNGKGSTCAMIESGLRAAGWKTGLYISPHLVEPTERIQLDSQPVCRNRFVDAFNRVHEAAEALIREDRLEHHPTYFETVTAMGFLVFAEAGIDVAVVEVGLGGRLDATNVLAPALCVITPIDYDHERWLGSSIESIAREKAGILKPGTPVVIAPQRPEALTVILDRASELSCPVIRQYHVEQLETSAEWSSLTVVGPRSSFRIRCPLAGAHQVENAATAVTALDQLGIDGPAIEQGIAATRWPGRLEIVSRNPDIILDGAHNPAGVRALANHVMQFYKDRTRWLVYGAMRDKSVQEITEILFPLFHRIILTAPDMPRAIRPEALAEGADHSSVGATANIREAMDIARTAAPDTAIFVTGSLYLVGEARALLVK
jgi:dihydrofolate synthase/folylpolyglutamate synthase